MTMSIAHNGIHKAIGKPRKDMLGSFRPAPQTTFWTCRTADCRTHVPLRVVKPDGLTSKTGSCPRCYRHRPLTADEHDLITGNDARGVKGWIGYVYKLADKFSKKRFVEFDLALSIAMEAACYAAATFDPANGFQFSTHLTQRLTGRMNERAKLQAQLVRNAHTHLNCDRGSADDNQFEAPLSLDHQSDAVQSDVRSYVRYALRVTNLTDRERDIIRRRFGLDCQPSTFNEIAAVYNTSRQRIQQMQARILGLIREAMGVDVEVAA